MRGIAVSFAEEEGEKEGRDKEDRKWLLRKHGNIRQVEMHNSNILKGSWWKVGLWRGIISGEVCLTGEGKLGVYILVPFVSEGAWMLFSRVERVDAGRVFLEASRPNAVILGSRRGHDQQGLMKAWSNLR